MRKIVGFSAGDGFAQLLLSGGGRVRLRVGDDWDELATRYVNVDFDTTAARDALEKSDLLLADMRESLKREHQHCLNAEHIACAQAKRASEAEESLRAALSAKESAYDARDHVQALYEEERAALAAADARTADSKLTARQLVEALRLAQQDADQWAEHAGERRKS